ncbi:MAG: helicase-related protein [Bacteroidales bacterium]
MSELLALAAADGLEAAMTERNTPVTLEPELLKEYMETFFPTTRNHKLAFRGIGSMVNEIFYRSAGINAMLSFSRYVLANGPLLEDMEDSAREAFLSSAIRRLLKDIEQHDKIIPEVVQNEAMFASGLIVRPSKVMKGGYDVAFEHVPGKGGCFITPSVDSSIISEKTNANYEEERMSSYTTELSLKVVKACKTILQDIFGKSFDIENAHKRKVAQLPLDFNFERLNSVFKTITGLDVPMFKNMPSEYATHYSKHFQILLIVDPNSALYHPWRTYTKSTAEDKVRPDNSEILGEEALWCGARVASSFAINLSKEECQYICQDSNISRPYYSLTILFTKWCSALLRRKGLRGTAGSGVEKRGKRVVARLPKVVIPMKSIGDLSKARKDNGLHVSKSRTNADGIVVDSNGLICYLPKSDQLDLNTAAEYEKNLDDLLAASYGVGAPNSMRLDTLNSDYYAIWANDPLIDKKILDKKKQVNLYRGALLAADWDFNAVISVGDSGEVAFRDLTGAVAPDDLIIADMLGFDFKEEGETEQYKTISEWLTEVGHSITPGKDKTDSTESINSILAYIGGRAPEPNFAGAHVMCSRRFLKLFDVYSYFAENGKLAPLSALISGTMAEMGITDFSESALDRNLYMYTLSDNGGLKSGLLYGLGGAVEQGHIVLSLLLSAMRDAMGDHGTNLARLIADEVGIASVKTELPTHASYFKMTGKSRLSDFGNLYTYFGGRLFKNMCAKIAGLDRKELLYPARSITDPRVDLLPSWSSVTNDIVPLSVIFSKYVPNYLDYFEKAEEIYEKNKPNTGIGVEDIIAPGVIKGAQVFPHQIKAHMSLRRKPKYAVLDVHPGGGKTVMGILDIMCLAHELGSQYFRPVVIAPDKLCRNWCEDTTKISGGNWNCIPITGETVNEWGAERLIELIRSAPRNTIIVTGINFLKTKDFTVSMGPSQVKVLGGVEFIKQFNPTYVLLDESHKAKTFNPGNNHVSQVHTAIKTIFTMDGIEFARLATGTLVHGRLTDVMGQAALFNAYTFKTPSTTTIDINDVDGPSKMRSKFGKYASVITLKRKEWAFMLPNPIDTFITTQLTDGGAPGNLLHAEVYQTVMKETLDKLAEEVDRIRKGGKPSMSDRDEDDDGEDTDNDSADDADDTDESMDEGDELSSLGTVRLQKYLQAVEQLVTDPWGDTAFQDAAKAANINEGDFVPSKIAAVLARLDVHFNIGEYTGGTGPKARIVRWVKGMEPLEFDVVEHNGIFYMRRLMKTDEQVSIERRKCPPSLIEPQNDLDNWKVEKRGKVIIFCRYTRCVDAVFNALPERYKSRARRFHGEVGQYGENKWKNLDAFATDPDVDILVANEQAISEGHNLQMGSRNIRVDTPWSPGEADQSAARIFRPDPSAAKVENGKPGDMAREVIYTDWIMTEGTTEVAKVARLMWKTVDKVKFDEKGNSRYDDLMEISLDRIPMSLQLLSEMNTMDQFREPDNDYFGAKALLSNIERVEFSEMRQTTIATMQDLPVPPIPKDYAILEQYPILTGQNIPDPDKYGYIRFVDWVRNTPHFSENLESRLHLCPVKTGFGTGVIVGFNINYTLDSEGKKVPDPSRPVTSVKVRYKSNDELVSHKVGNIFVPQDLAADEYDRFFSTTKPWSTESERIRIEKAAQKEAERIAATTRKREAKRRSDKDAGEMSVRTGDRKRIRRTNVENGRPINEGVKVVSRLPRQENNVGTTKRDSVNGPGDMRVKVIPSMYNGFIALHVTNNDIDSKKLAKFEFKPHGEFIYVDFKNYKHMEGFIDWVESKFVLDRASEKRIETVLSSFEDTGRMGFNARLATKVQSELANFYRTRHKESTDRKALKIYPSVLHDRVRLSVDVATNLAATRLKGKTIPNAGAGATWKEHPGMHLFLAVNKRAALSKLKELTTAGFTVTNLAKVMEAITTLKLK